MNYSKPSAAKKPLAEMNLVDNFLFGAAMDHEKYGPIIAKTILETILRRKIRIKRVNSEKVIWPSDSNLHGIRLDAYLEEEGAADISPGSVYDLEPDKKKEEKASLPKRSRYYHARMDSKLLQASQSYQQLPEAWVIFITTFDPFDANRMVYTFQTKCVEIPDLKYEDGIVTMFLYVHGTEGNPPEDLQALLRYMDQTCAANASNPNLKQIQTCIDNIKQDPEIGRTYMDWEYYIESERREAAREAEKERDSAISQRDSALARVRELEAENARLRNLNQKSEL